MWSHLCMEKWVLQTVLPFCLFRNICTHEGVLMTFYLERVLMTFCMSHGEDRDKMARYASNYRAKIALGLLFCWFLQKYSSRKLDLCWVSLWALCYYTLKSVLQKCRRINYYPCVHGAYIKAKRNNKRNPNSVNVLVLYFTWKIL